MTCVFFQENEIKERTLCLQEIDEILVAERSKCDALKLTIASLEQRIKDAKNQYKNVETTIREKKVSDFVVSPVFYVSIIADISARIGSIKPASVQWQF